MMNNTVFQKPLSKADFKDLSSTSRVESLELFNSLTRLLLMSKPTVKHFFDDALKDAVSESREELVFNYVVQKYFHITIMFYVLQLSSPGPGSLSAG